MALATMTLQEILFPNSDITNECPELFFRDGLSKELAENRTIPDENRWDSTLSNGIITRHDGKPIDVRVAKPIDKRKDITRPHYSEETKQLVIPANTTADLSCYFNMFSAAKWLDMTCAKNISLKLKVQGEGVVDVWSYKLDDIKTAKEAGKFLGKQHGGIPDDSLVTNQINSVDFACDEPQELVIPVGHPDVTLVGFSISATSDCLLLSGEWYATLDDTKVNDVNLCIATTTFQKEEYILRNIATVKRMLAEEAELNGHFQMIVVDNGRTLDAQEIEDEHVRVFGNDNTGGAGGFARGMIEALRLQDKPTHLIIMDDDVTLYPDSMKRTYRFLRLLKPKYRDCYLAGAMLRMENPYIQHEDIGYINETGGFFLPKRGVHQLRTIIDCASNEIPWVDCVYEYAAWWFCCVPMKFITEKTLPIPFFVRGDDVEFSIRNKARIISLNGICVWHMGFGEKFSAQMEYYQVMRNSLILQAFHPHCAKINFAPRCNTLFTSLIEEFSYDYAELILDAVEDFMSGPSIISKPNGLEVIKEKGKKNETLRPLSEVWSGTVDFTKVFNYDRLKYPDSVLRRKMVTFSHNGQGKLQKLVSSDMGFTSYDWEFVQQTVFMKKRVLVVNPYEATGAIHERDPQRYEELVARRDRVFERYNAEHESIERAYREAYPRLTSLEFWTEYLNLDK